MDGSCSLATESANRVATSAIAHTVYNACLHTCLHLSPRTRRTWKPNVQNKRLYSEILDEMVPLKVTTYALRYVCACERVACVVLHNQSTIEATMLASCRVARTAVGRPRTPPNNAQMHHPHGWLGQVHSQYIRQEAAV